MKTKTFSRAKMFFLLLPIMAVAFYTASMIAGGSANSVFTPAEAVESVSDMEQTPAQGTPLDYSPMENFKFANWTIYNASYFQSVAQGEVKADLGFTKYTQNVKNTRKVKNKTVFSEAISSSSLISVAEQKYITPKNVVLYRPSEKVKGDSVVWSDSIYPMNTDTYFTKYGLVPREITKYAVTEESVLSAKLLSFTDNEYVYEFELNPEIAGFYFKNEIRTLAGAAQDPVIKSMKATITLDDNWYVKTALTVDVYDIGIPVLGSMTCESRLLETFEYINEDMELAESELFDAYLPEDGDEIIDVEIKDKSASDYLAQAFAPYINGQPLNVNIDVLAMGENHNIKAAVDISSMNADVLIDNALYIGYKDDRVYIGAGGLKGYLPLSALSALDGLLPLPSDGFNFADMISDDVITALFNDSDITKSDGIVTINLKFKLSDILKTDSALYDTASKIELDVDLIINENGDDISLNRIDATVKVSSLPLLITVVPSDTLTFPDVSEFTDLQGAVDFVKPAVNTINGKAFNIDFTAKIDSPSLRDTLNAKVSLNRDLSFSADLTLVNANVKLNLRYDNTAAYITCGNLRLKLDCADIDELSGKLQEVFGKVTLPEFDNPLQGLSNSDILSALLSLDLGELLSHIRQFQPISDTQLRAAIDYDGNTYGVVLSRDDNYLTALNVDEISLNGVSVKIDVALDVSESEISFPPVANNFVDVNELADFIQPIKELIDAQSYDFDAVICVGEINVNANMKLLRTADGVKISALLNAFGLNIQIIFDGDTVYLNTGNIRVKTALTETDDLAALLKELIPSADTQQLDAMLTAIALPQAMDVDFIMNTLLKGVTLSGGKLGIELDMNGTVAAATISLNNGAVSSVGISAGIDGLDVLVKLNLNSLNSVSKINTPSDEYSSLKDFVAFIKPAVNTINKNAFDLSFDVKVDGINVGGQLRVNKDLSAFDLNLTLTDYDASAFILFKDNTLYISALGFNLSASAADLPLLKEELLPLLSDSDKEIASAVLDVLQSLLSGGFSVSDLIGSNGDMSFNDISLDSIDLKALLEKVEYLRVTENKATVTVSGITLRLTHDGALLNSAAADGSANGVAFSADIALTHASDENYVLTVPDKNYLEIKNILPFVQPIMELTANNMFVLDLHALLMSDGAAVTTTVNITGQITVLMKESGLQLQLNLNIPQSDGSTTEIILAAQNGNIYLVYDNTRIKFENGDFDKLSEMLSPYLPAFTPRLIAEISQAVKNSMPDMDTAALLKILADVTMPNATTLRLDLDLLGLPMTADLSLKDGALDKLSLSAFITDANYEGESVYVNADISIAKMSADAERATLAATDLHYVQASELYSFLGALLNTFTQDAYRVSLDEIVANYADKTQRVVGYIEFLPSNSIPNLKAHLEVYEGGAGADLAATQPLHTFDIMITDGDGMQEIYLTYNGVKFKLTVEEVTYLIGNLKDVLAIKDGTLLDYVVPADREKVSGDFLKDFNITQITDMSDLLNGILELATRIYDEAQLFMNDYNYDYHALGDTLNSMLDSLNSLMGNTESKPLSASDVLNMLTSLPKVSVLYSESIEYARVEADVDGTVFRLDRLLGENSYLTHWAMSNLITDNSTATFSLSMDCPDSSQIVIQRPVYHDYNYATTTAGGKYKAKELADSILEGKIAGVTLPDYYLEYVDHDTSYTASDVIPSRRYKKVLWWYDQSNSGSYVLMENGDYIGIDDFVSSIKNRDYVEFNNTYYTYAEFTAKKNLVHLADGSTQSFDSYYEKWFVSTYNMSYSDYYNLYLIGNQLNDLSHVTDLTTALINTANLKDFHITGNLNVVIDIKVTKIKVDVPVDIRVKLIPVTLADGTVVNKPLVAVNISTPKYSFIVTVLSRSASQIYYWDGYMYFNKLQDGKYSYVKVSMEDFAAQAADTAQLMKYVFYIAPLMDMAKDGINDAIAKGGDTTPGSFKDFYDYYYYKDSRHYAQIDLASLAGNTNLANAEVFIGTQKLDIGKGTQSFMRELGFTTTMVSIVSLKFEARLVDIGDTVDYFRTPTGFNGDTPNYQDNDINTLIDYLTGRTDYGTIDNPYTA